jgi:hypothetical protein
MCMDAAKSFDRGSHTVGPSKPVILETCLETQRSGEAPENKIVVVKMLQSNKCQQRHDSSNDVKDVKAWSWYSLARLNGGNRLA